MKTKYDAVVVGSGPNGFAAAITLQRRGLSVLLIEAKETLGGGVSCAPLTLPGFIHDVCASVFALAEDSPVFKYFNLQQFGLEYLTPQYAIAHPFDDGNAVVVETSIENTAAQLGKDATNYKKIFFPLVKNWPSIRSAFVSPLHWSAPTVEKLRFAWNALSSGIHFAKNNFQTQAAQSLFAGMAAHSMLPLHKITTSSIGLVLNTLAHVNGWPLAKGGAQQITNALASCFQSFGGEIQTGNKITSLRQLPPAKIIMLDVTPAQLLSIGSDQFSALYKWQLRDYQYGEGVFKVDWALSKSVPFLNEKCRKAGTVHLGGTLNEISNSEAITWKGMYSEKPFVLLVQPGVVDASRAPEGKQTAWAYCHVPNGSQKNMTDAIEQQIERFAPGFSVCILARHTMDTAEMQAYNSNYIGGDINGGASIATQIFTRPVLRLSPYRTSAERVYVCSSSTPPGGGVHGLCGYYAARRAVKDVYGVDLGW